MIIVFFVTKLFWYENKNIGNILCLIFKVFSSFKQDSPRDIDKSRKFIISYRLGDDTISIHEPPQRNTGIIGGRFLERTRVSKPGKISIKIISIPIWKIADQEI